MPDLSFSDAAVPVTTFESRHVAATHLASGAGTSHSYLLHFESEGVIGPHVAGFDQLFLVLGGTAWIEVNGHRTQLGELDAVVLRRGDLHSKGSATGATVLMVQADQLTPGAPGALP